MDLYFTFEFRDCLDLFCRPIGLKKKTCSNLTCNAGDKCQNFVVTWLCNVFFAEEGIEMDLTTHVHSHCFAHKTFLSGDVLIAL